MHSFENRQDHLKELSNLIYEKTKNTMDDPNQMTLVCGDFNINALEDSMEYKQFILSYNEDNNQYLQLSEAEYELMIAALERGINGSITDLIKLTFGMHPKTYLYPTLEKIKS